MKNSLLTLLLLVSFIVAMQSQDVNDIDRDCNIEENLAPHFHLHENGYYYVGDDFLNPNSDRGNKPVLDSITFVNVTSNGDTSYRYEHYYTISDENRIIKITKRENYPSSFQGYVTRDVFITYEMDGDDIIQFDTTYEFSHAGVSELEANFITHINSQGLVTRIQSQGYYNGEWMNAYLYVADFNEFGCLLSKMEYTWKENKWNPLNSWEYTCEETMKITEYHSRYEILDTTEIPAQLIEYEYDEFNRLSQATLFRPQTGNPVEYILDNIKLYTYDENELNDSIISHYWDENNEEFILYNIATFKYDELKNKVETKIHYIDTSNNVLYITTEDLKYDNNFLKGDFLSGTINSDLNSMLLKKTLKTVAFPLVETQYFYSEGGVSSKEKVKTINFEVYPNPTSGDLHINISDIIDDKSQIVIRNSTGSVVFSQNAESKNNLNLANLPSGFYLVSIEGANFRSEVKKLIIK